MREADVAQALRRNDARDRLAYEWKQPARPRVKEQRLFVDDQVLIEAELTNRQRDRCVDAINAIGDLMHIGPGMPVGDHLELLATQPQRFRLPAEPPARNGPLGCELWRGRLLVLRSMACVARARS